MLNVNEKVISCIYIAHPLAKKRDLGHVGQVAVDPDSASLHSLRENNSNVFLQRVQVCCLTKTHLSARTDKDSRSPSSKVGFK